MGESIKIGITGLPGAGKTEALVSVIKMLEENDWIVGGMITENIMEDEERAGFYVTNWCTRQRGILAHVEMKSNVTVGQYGVNLEVLEAIGVPAIEEATENADVIVIDEVGKMEVESKKFIDSVKDAIDVDKPMILTLHKKSRNPLLQDIRRRDDVRILEVTPVNRALLPYKIVKLLTGELL
jgi:nucleoside-triphosphatase